MKKPSIHNLNAMEEVIQDLFESNNLTQYHHLVLIYNSVASSLGLPFYGEESK